MGETMDKSPVTGWKYREIHILYVEPLQEM